MKGLEVCRMHGGKTPRGPASPNYKDGRYSRFVPSRMAAAYRVAGLDPEIMSLHRDLALLEARIIDVLKRVDTGEAGTIWQAAQAAMVRFDRAWVKKDGEGMEAALAEIKRHLDQGAADWAAWQEVGSLIEQRRKLVESEQRRLTLAHDVLTQSQAMAMMGQVLDIIRRHVADRGVLNAIALDVQAIGHRGNGHTAEEDTTRFTC